MAFEDDLLKHIQSMLSKKTIGLNVLEAQINVEKQMEYLEYTRKIKKAKSVENVLVRKDLLFDPNVEIEDKKHLLCELARLDEVEAYRAIEKYLENADEELRDWAQLAHNESRIVLESTLLDESQIFISTGLGGKGQKLRYFVVLISSSNDKFSNLHENIIRKEFEFALSKNDGELESIEFMEIYAAITCIVPINVPLYQVLREAVDESNQIGGFIKDNFIVTNVKKFSLQEIEEFINKNDEKNPDDEDDYDDADYDDEA